MFYMVWEINPYSNHNDNCSEIKITAKEPLGASSLFIFKNSPDWVIYLHYHPLQYCLHPDRENFRKILPIGVISLYQYLPQYVSLDHVLSSPDRVKSPDRKNYPWLENCALLVSPTPEFDPADFNRLAHTHTPKKKKKEKNHTNLLQHHDQK